MLEKLESLIEREQPIISFLKTLTDADKKKLVPKLKKLHQKYFISDHYSHSKVVNVKRELIKKACFVCFNKAEMKRTFGNAVSLCLNKQYLQEIIPWYKPKWYSEIINEELPWGFSYKEMMNLKNNGIFEPSDESIATSLTRSLDIIWVGDKVKRTYNPKSLLQYKETLEKHIWLLFEVETELHWVTNYDKIDYWIDTFVNFSNDRKLNRNRVIQATIRATNKGFERGLSLWFGRLLVALKPTETETLTFQEDFISALNSPFSGVVNSVLKPLKTVANHKVFQHQNFLENSSILLNSETKSVVTSTLMIFDKIAKAQPKLQQEVCLKSLEALLNTDEKIQERASKIIVKYGDINELTSEINLYLDSLFFSSKEILKDFITIEEVDTEEINEIEEIKLLNEKVETFKTFDELLFFVSQAIDNNEVYHIDLLMSNLPKLNLLITSENVSKLEPILSRAFKITSNYEDWTTQKGYIEHLAGIYLNDFGMFLLEKYPKELGNFQQNIDKRSKEVEKHTYFKNIKEIFKPLEKTQIKRQIYDLHKSLLMQSRDLYLENSTLEMLSTPTHKPCWIAPKTLIERIISYEKAEKEFDLLDFQIAIGRLPINEFPNVLEIELIKHQEIKSVLNYHFGFEKFGNDKIKTPQLWIQSVLNKNNEVDVNRFRSLTNLNLVNEKGIRTWECKEREYDYGYGDKRVSKELIFEDISSLKIDILFRIENIGFKNQKGIYSFFILKRQLYNSTLRPHDDVKYLNLLPNNPNPLLSQLTIASFRNSTILDADGRRNIVYILKGLHKIWCRSDYEEATYLFIAISFLCNEKTARELAAELWIKANQQNTMNNEFLGKLLGKLEHQEYGALKRFTDLIVSNMFQVSKLHNEKLLILLDNMLSEMNEKPIRNTKKLIELFFELQCKFVDYKISKNTLVIFEKWKAVKSLALVIKKIKIT